MKFSEFILEQEQQKLPSVELNGEYVHVPVYLGSKQDTRILHFDGKNYVVSINGVWRQPRTLPPGLNKATKSGKFRGEEKDKNVHGKGNIVPQKQLTQPTLHQSIQQPKKEISHAVFPSLDKLKQLASSSSNDIAKVEELTNVCMQLQELNDDELNAFLDENKEHFSIIPSKKQVYFYSLEIDKKTGEPKRTGKIKATKGVSKLTSRLETMDNISSVKDEFSWSQAFKAEVKDIPNVQLKQMGCNKGSPKNMFEYITSRFAANLDFVDKIKNVIKTCNEIGMTKIVGADAQTFFSNEKDYKIHSTMLASTIIERTLNEHQKRIDEAGLFMDEEISNMHSINKRIVEYVRTTKDDQDTQLKKVGQLYHKMSTAIYGAHGIQKPIRTRFRNEDDYNNALKTWTTRNKMSQAFLNNIGEIHAFQAEILHGDLCYMPESGTSEVGDKLKLLMSNKRGIKSTNTNFVEVGFENSEDAIYNICYPVVAVKKGDETETTVGAPNSVSGIPVGMIYKDEKTRNRIITATNASATILKIENANGEVIKKKDSNNIGSNVLDALETDEDGELLNIIFEQQVPEDIRMKIAAADYIKKYKKYKQEFESENKFKFEGIRKAEFDKQFDPEITRLSGVQLEQMAKEARIVLGDRVKEIHSNDEKYNIMKGKVLEMAGANTPEFDKDRKAMIDYISKNNTIKDWKKKFINSIGSEDDTAETNIFLNRFVDYLQTNDHTKLTARDIQLATVMIAASQKIDEIIEYGVNDIVDYPDGPALRYTPASTKIDGKSIHDISGSNILGFLISFNVLPNFKIEGKIANVRKSSNKNMQYKLGRILNYRNIL